MKLEFESMISALIPCESLNCYQVICTKQLYPCNWCHEQATSGFTSFCVGISYHLFACMAVVL
jgi:hypothetical protein